MPKRILDNRFGGFEKQKLIQDAAKMVADILCAEVDNFLIKEKGDDQHVRVERLNKEVFRLLEDYDKEEVLDILVFVPGEINNKKDISEDDKILIKTFVQRKILNLRRDVD